MKMGGDQVYEFEGFTLDLARRVFSDGNGSPIKLMPKAFDLLAFLVENNHRVVSKDEIMSELWPDTIVEENNLTQNISSLRRVFGEKPHENRFISTIPGRGYRFVAAVRKDEDAEGSTGKKAVDVHSARSDDDHVCLGCEPVCDHVLSARGGAEDSCGRQTVDVEVSASGGPT